MRILISNDDGVFAPGIIALAAELSKIAEICVIAPDRNRSGASNSLTIQIPVRVRQLNNGFYSVTGTPTDCVHMAVTGLFDMKFDMVVSGINAGANLGDDVLYSGTVAAATEGRMLGLPSVAVSLVGESPQKNYETAAVVARQVVESLKKEPLPSGTILNVNVPDVDIHELQGFSVTHLGSRHPAKPAVKAIDPRGSVVYWIGEAGDEDEQDTNGSDFHAVNMNKVSITPLLVDFTNHAVMDKTKKWVSSLLLCKK